MAKVITFSRTFQKGHPKAGKPTFFVEALWESIYLDHPEWLQDKHKVRESFYLSQHGLMEPKHHTIRGGNRFKVGDWFSPRVWSGQPYKSKQIIVGPDLEVKQVWTFEFYHWGEMFIDGRRVGHDLGREIAKNDGLSWNDFYEWFPTTEIKHFDGQIICWSDKVDYSEVRWEQLKLTDVSLH